MTIWLWMFVIVAAPLALGAIVIAYAGMIATIKDEYRRRQRNKKHKLEQAEASRLYDYMTSKRQ